MNQIEKPLISIIIPVYKVEDYLERCVDSVLNQTYENIEVILVDDGSPDKCGEMCDKYAQKHDNVIVIHQKNQGLSAARNTGIRTAKGQFLGFVDSDDFIEKNMYELLYDVLEVNNADISVGGIIDCYEETGIKEKDFNKEVKVYTGEEAIKDVLINQGNITAHVVTKLYRKQIFDMISFPEGKLYEDSFTIIDFLIKAEKIAVVNHGVYYYWHRGGSIVESPFSERDMHLIRAWENNQKTIMKKMPELKEAIEFRYFWSCFYLLDKIYIEDKKHNEEAELVYILKNNFSNIIKNKYFRKNRKLAMVVLKISRKCYKILCRMKSK